MLDKICQYRKKHKLRVPNPNYEETNIYYEQWKCLGGTMFYQLPNKGRIIALFQRGLYLKKNFRFFPRGITYKTVEKIEKDRLEDYKRRIGNNFPREVIVSSVWSNKRK